MIRSHEQITRSGQRIGWLTLDLPASLNALTLDMASHARAQLASWSSDPGIACVVLCGEGRAFCAGGDVRRMRQGILAGDDYCERFFEQEYRLDYAVHTFPKPVLAWGHGVVMGGGLGLLVGASHRVVTPSTRMAMPETSIGLFPDVGASHFLQRLPEGLGLFLAITGCEWNGADAVAMGLADFLLDDALRDTLPDYLDAVPWTREAATNRQQLTTALLPLARTRQEFQLVQQAGLLSHVCRDGLPAAIALLQTLPLDAPWFVRALDNLARGCPVTARLAEEQLRRGRNQSLAEAFRMEWNLATACCRHPDFPEGVRAQLVDKDRQPRWSHADIAAVPDAYVLAHFESRVQPHPLQDLGQPNNLT